VTSTLPPETGASNNRRSAIHLLIGSLVCVGLGQSLLFTVLPPLARTLGLVEWQVGAVFAFSGLMWFVMSPFWGRKSDRWGRKPVVLLGITGYGLSMALLIAVIEANLAGWISLALAFPLMVLVRGIFGLVGSGAFPAAQAYIADRTSRAERTSNIALINAAFGIGVVLGPGLGALLIGAGLLAPLYAVAAIAFFSALMITLFLPENPVTRQQRQERAASRKLSFLDRRILPLAIASVVMSICQSATMQTAAFFTMDLLDLTPESAALKSGIALTISAAASLLVQVVVIRQFGLGPKVLLIWGAAIALSGYVVFLLSESYVPVVLALVLHGVGLGMLRPGLGSAASLTVGPGEQGAAAGLIMATGPVGHVLTPFIIMPLYQIYIFSPYIVTGVLMAGLLVYILVNPTIQAVLGRTHV
tara:strand:+ start:2393 stop:3643 length:1251 start_codon:yes stop_codon:yes gene_type:complete